MPVKSPHRPIGNKNMAVDNRNAVTTQLKVTASRPKSFSMAGNAMFTDEIRKVPKKELVATIANIEICFFVQFISVTLCLHLLLSPKLKYKKYDRLVVP